jgi:hypothetical protein
MFCHLNCFGFSVGMCVNKSGSWWDEMVWVCWENSSFIACFCSSVAFRKIAKSDYSLLHVCLSVCLSVRFKELGSQWADIHEIKFASIFQRLEAAQMKFLRHLLGITKLDKEKNQRIRGKNWGTEHSKGNKTVPGKVAKTRTEDGQKQNTKTNTKT